MRYVDAWWSADTEVPADTEVDADIEIDASEGAEKMLELFFAPAIITIACDLTMSAAGEMTAKNTRIIRNAALMAAEGEMSANVRKYRVNQLEFTGEFRPGDQIVIDNERLLFLLNGQNGLYLMKGDFFDLNTGQNEIIYTDNQSGRTVRMRITFRDRYV